MRSVQIHFSLTVLTVLLASLTFTFSCSNVLAQDSIASESSESQTQLENRHPAKLLLQMKSSRFSVRQNAMFRLIGSSASTIRLIENEIESGDADFRARALKILEHLAINDSSQSDEALNAIRRISLCQDTTLSRKAQFSTFDVLLHRQHAAAKRLERMNAKITYAAAMDGSGFRMAEKLNIDETWRGSRKDLDDVGHLFGLSSLTLCHEQIDDEFAKSLLRAYTLSHIKFKKCSISNDAIKCLSRSNSLAKLEVFYCNVGPECFQQLQAFERLSSITLIGTQVDPNFSELLEQRLNAKIDIRNGAFLGIRYSPLVAQCVVTWIVEGSGAQKSGFRVGDEIIEFDSKPINQHIDLTNVLRHQKAGDWATAKVLRGTKQVELKVLMGEWD